MMVVLQAKMRKPDGMRSYAGVARIRALITLCLPTSMAASSRHGIFENNPYEGLPSLTELEAEVLWEYAKLSQNVKDVRKHACTRRVLTSL